MRSGKWKLITFYDLEKTELYNLDADPGEMNDLSAIYPEKVHELSIKLAIWQEKTGAFLPTQNSNN